MIPAFLFGVAAIIITSQSQFTVTSPDFDNNDTIPIKYSCEGANVNPELNLAGIPSGTQSLALIVQDTDILLEEVIHWVMWDIPVTDTIAENSHEGLQGRNFYREVGYDGPCPNTGGHHYRFTVYALDTKLGLKEGSEKKQLETAMEGHILASTQLVGVYKMSTYMAKTSE